MSGRLSPEEKEKKRLENLQQKELEKQESQSLVRQNSRTKNNASKNLSPMAETKTDTTTAVEKTPVVNNPAVNNSTDPLVVTNESKAAAGEIKTNPVVQQKAGPVVNEPELAFGQPNTTYRPFRGNTIKRSYSSAPVDHNIVQPIRKASFEQPKMDAAKLEQLSKTMGGQLNTIIPQTGNGPQQVTPQIVPNQIIGPNPGVIALPTEDQNRAAEQLVDILIGGYEKLHALGRHVLKVSNEDTAVLEMRGDISLKQQVPIGTEANGDLKTVSLGAFLADYNKKIEGEFVVSKDFITKVRPPLIRSFAKKGWGVTDDQYVMFMIAEDVSAKVFQVIGFKRQMNKFMDLCKVMYEKEKAKTVAEPVKETVAQVQIPAP